MPVIVHLHLVLSMTATVTSYRAVAQVRFDTAEDAQLAAQRQIAWCCGVGL